MTARTARRQAAVMAVIEVLLNLALWVPLPVGALWVGSQVEYRSESLSLGALVGLAVLIAGVRCGIVILRRVDARWVALRCRAGDVRETGVLGPVAAACAAVGACVFTVWLVLIGGISPMIFRPE